MSRDIFGYQNWRWGGISTNIQWVEAREASTHCTLLPTTLTTLQCTDSPAQGRIIPTPNDSGALVQAEQEGKAFQGV